MLWGFWDKDVWEDWKRRCCLIKHEKWREEVWHSSVGVLPSTEQDAGERLFLWSFSWTFEAEGVKLQSTSGQHFLSTQTKLPPVKDKALCFPGSQIRKDNLHLLQHRRSLTFTQHDISYYTAFSGVRWCVRMCVCVWDDSCCRFSKEALTHHTLLISV